MGQGVTKTGAGPAVLGPYRARGYVPLNNIIKKIISSVTIAITPNARTIMRLPFYFYIYFLNNPFFHINGLDFQLKRYNLLSDWGQRLTIGTLHHSRCKCILQNCFHIFRFFYSWFSPLYAAPVGFIWARHYCSEYTIVSQVGQMLSESSRIWLCDNSGIAWRIGTSLYQKLFHPSCLTVICVSTPQSTHHTHIFLFILFLLLFSLLYTIGKRLSTLYLKNPIPLWFQFSPLCRSTRYDPRKNRANSFARSRIVSVFGPLYPRVSIVNSLTCDSVSLLMIR